jgi:hypothetical protein
MTGYYPERSRRISDLKEGMFLSSDTSRRRFCAGFEKKLSQMRHGLADRNSMKGESHEKK